MNLSMSKTAGNYAPRVFAQRPDRKGYGRGEFESAMHRPIAGRRIAMEDYGRKGDARQRIVRRWVGEGAANDAPRSNAP